MMKIKTRGYHCLLAPSILLFTMVFSLSYVHATSWPTSNCAEADYWLEFAELQVCIERERVTHLNHLNLSSPSLSMLVEFDNRSEEVGFSRLDDQKVTGGLHQHLQMSAKEMFALLVESKRKDDTVTLTRRVMGVDDNTQIASYKANSLNAYVFVKANHGYSSIYLIHEEREGAILIAGMFDEREAAYLLSRVRW